MLNTLKWKVPSLAESLCQSQMPQTRKLFPSSSFAHKSSHKRHFRQQSLAHLCSTHIIFFVLFARKTRHLVPKRSICKNPNKNHIAFPFCLALISITGIQFLLGPSFFFSSILLCYLIKSISPGFARVWRCLGSNLVALQAGCFKIFHAHLVRLGCPFLQQWRQVGAMIHERNLRLPI